MAKGYRPVLRDQAFLLPPDMREWLPDDDPVWLVIAVAEGHLDTGLLHAGRRAGGPGAAGYDPVMLVTLLVWAYAHQVTSSRRIERLCRTDVAFRVICAGDVPDHVTIARFRAGLGEAAGELFASVLVLCARLGMGQLGMVALDGMKIAASASVSANRGREGLAKLAAGLAARHAEADAAEDALFGAGRRGDEVPAELADPRTRAERVTAALADLEAADAAAREEQREQAAGYLDAAAAGKPPRGGRPAGADVAGAQLRVDRLAAAQQARIDDWDARNAASLARAGTKAPNPPRRPASEHVRVRQAAARLEKARAREQEAAARAARKAAGRKGPVRNVTDPHSRLMPVRGGGFIQGYNTQNVTSADGLIIATELTADPADTGWFEPMLRQAEAAAELITAARPPPVPGQAPAGEPAGPAAAPHLIGLFLADAGYLSEANLTCDGPDRLIATGKHRDLERTARGGGPGPWQRTGPATTAMAARLATPDGITAYRHRGHIAETPHGNIKHNKGFRQLSVRGKPRATAEWTLACTVHNLFKAITAGKLTRPALAALAS